MSIQQIIFSTVIQQMSAGPPLLRWLKHLNTSLSQESLFSSVSALLWSEHLIYNSHSVFVLPPLLSLPHQKTVDCMTTMSVPSTLVKCLYLFFDLPHMAEAPVVSTPQPPAPPPPTPTQEKTSGQVHTQPELPLADRRALLQKVFVQVRWLLDRLLLLWTKKTHKKTYFN